MKDRAVPSGLFELLDHAFVSCGLCKPDILSVSLSHMFKFIRLSYDV